MSIRNTGSPYGGGPTVVDHFIGRAYPVVKFVSDNMHHIHVLSDQMEAILTNSNNIVAIRELAVVRMQLLAVHAKLLDLQTITNNMASIQLVATEVDALVELHGELGMLRLLTEKLPQLATLSKMAEEIAAMASSLPEIKTVAQGLNSLPALQIIVDQVEELRQGVAEMTALRTEVRQVIEDRQQLGERVNKTVLFYPDYASAEAAAATLPDGQLLDVADEGKQYRVEATALVFVKNLDQLRIDLADKDQPKMGSGLVPTVARFVKTIAQLKDTPTTFNQMVHVAGYYAPGDGGGGTFLAMSGAATPDGGSVIASATTGEYWKRVNPQATPYEFGYRDGDADVAGAANACTAAYGRVLLDGGKVYDLQHQINARHISSRGTGRATLNLTSPTNNGRFGAPVSGPEWRNQSAVLFWGGNGSVMRDAWAYGIDVRCNGIINASGGVGTKGFVFRQCKGFLQIACDVHDCASYAFWDMDDATTGTVHCSGNRYGCRAFDSAVSFEQVNVRGVTLDNCHGYISNKPLNYVPECIFHPYGGSDMQVVYNNCTGIADGRCPTILLALLECKNVSANNCQFLNRYDAGSSIQAAVYFEGNGGDFDRINFNNCVLQADYSPAVFINPGANGSASAAFAFTDCEISGKSLGVQFGGTGGYYAFNNCITTGTSKDGATAFGYYNNGAGNSFQMTGGRASGIGGPAPQSSNLPASAFNKTILTPAGIGDLLVRQRKIGTVTLASSGTYASAAVALPFASVNAAKVTVSAMVDATGAASGPAAAAAAVPLSYFALDATNYRVYAAASAAGLSVTYTLTEYE